MGKPDGSIKSKDGTPDDGSDLVLVVETFNKSNLLYATKNQELSQGMIWIKL